MKTPSIHLASSSLTLFAALAASASAQNRLTASETIVGLASGFQYVAGTVADASLQLSLGADAVFLPQVSVDASFRLTNGVAAVEFTLAPGSHPPLIAAVVAPTGKKAGGEFRSAIGLGLVGATILFGGASAQVLGPAPGKPLDLRVITPLGTSLGGACNPLGLVDVQAIEAGAAEETKRAAFGYLPALVQTGPAATGETLRLAIADGSGQPLLVIVAVALAGSGALLPLPPFGCLELPLPPASVVIAQVIGAGTVEIAEPIPDKSGLKQLFDLQGLVVPLSAATPSFTNRIQVRVQ